MRLTNLNMGIRTVMEDTILEYNPTGDETGPANCYLLKKGSNVQRPANIINYGPSSLWGDDRNEFNARRWLKTKEGERQ
ncbi:hypothetical protein BJ878DRAFT_491897 [Calycina marina]|uniref:Uncharacterized protein n=1 Tax=Calycina marina TaxID=1763456 RepID=A0A9P7Z8Q8_9HELO|nr:hypothetical protein BJ878DRAFT_491897 [Calycina marina]